MENTSFSYQYSAKNKKEAEMIREKYLPKEESKLEMLTRLDKKVERAGVFESLCVGIVGALVFGLGMCFGLDALQGSDALAYVFGVLGVLIMLPAYPIYKYLSKKAKYALSAKILNLSEEIMNG